MFEAVVAEDRPRTGVIGRGMVLLELVATSDDGVGVRDAARRTGIDRSAVSRILNQLAEMGYVDQEPIRGLFVPGPRIFAMVAALSEKDSLWKAAEPYLQELVARYNETAYIAARDGDMLVFRGKVDCQHRIRYVIELGKPFKLTTGAAGTAILSGMPESESDAVLAQGLEEYTEHSFTDPADYREQLRRDRALGYSFSPGRWVRNGAGIASPYWDATGQCAGSVTLSCPADRLELLSIEEAGTAVRDAARELSHRLGYTGVWGE